MCELVWCCVLGAPDYYILALPWTTSRRWAGGAAELGPSNFSVLLGWSPTRPSREHPVVTNLVDMAAAPCSTWTSAVVSGD